MGSSSSSSSSPTDKAPASAPAMHQSDADEDDDNVKQLSECSVLYLTLQECLVQTNRNWKSCQPEVQALKACQARRTSGKEK